MKTTKKFRDNFVDIDTVCVYNEKIAVVCYADIKGMILLNTLKFDLNKELGKFKILNAKFFTMYILLFSLSLLIFSYTSL